MNKRRNFCAGAPEDEIEITAAMIAAGVSAVAASPFLWAEAFEENNSTKNLVCAVYRAMLRAHLEDS